MIFLLSRYASNIMPRSFSLFYLFRVRCNLTYTKSRKIRPVTARNPKSREPGVLGLQSCQKHNIYGPWHPISWWAPLWENCGKCRLRQVILIEAVLECKFMYVSYVCEWNSDVECPKCVIVTCCWCVGHSVISILKKNPISILIPFFFQ